MKLFTNKDVEQHGAISDCGKIYADRTELVDSPLEWQKRGLQQTASGYGRKLTTSLKINFNGKLRRIYCTCFSNAGSCWFITKGKKIFVD
ncbi:MAG: hypothetical protein Q7R95_11415 [bacterium]|nr:hypothetical protein [bacterium]